MTFPTRQSVTSSNWTASPTSHPVTMPATVNAGDLLIVLWTFRTTGSATTTTPTGWTKLGSQANTTSNSCELAIYAKDAVGDEDGTTVDFVTSAGKNAAASVYRITGWRDSGTLANDVEVGFVQQANSANPNPPSKNPTNWDVEDTKWIAVAAYNGDDNATLTSGYPASYSDGVNIGDTVGFTTCGLSSAHRDVAASSEDPGAFTLNGTTNPVAGIVAIRPAAAAGGTNMQVNIGDAWKAVPAMQINIGDVWKTVAGAQINIGDAWKTII